MQELSVSHACDVSARRFSYFPRGIGCGKEFGEEEKAGEGERSNGGSIAQRSGGVPTVNGRGGRGWREYRGEKRDAKTCKGK